MYGSRPRTRTNPVEPTLVCEEPPDLDTDSSVNFTRKSVTFQHLSRGHVAKRYSEWFKLSRFRASIIDSLEWEFNILTWQRRWSQRRCGGQALLKLAEVSDKKEVGHVIDRQTWHVRKVKKAIVNKLVSDGYHGDSWSLLLRLTQVNGGQKFSHNLIYFRLKKYQT